MDAIVKKYSIDPGIFCAIDDRAFLENMITMFCFEQGRIIVDYPPEHFIDACANNFEMNKYIYEMNQEKVNDIKNLIIHLFTIWRTVSDNRIVNESWRNYDNSLNWMCNIKKTHEEDQFNAIIVNDCTNNEYVNYKELFSNIYLKVCYSLRLKKDCAIIVNTLKDYLKNSEWIKFIFPYFWPPEHKNFFEFCFKFISIGKKAPGGVEIYFNTQRKGSNKNFINQDNLEKVLKQFNYYGLNNIVFYPLRQKSLGKIIELHDRDIISNIGGIGIRKESLEKKGIFRLNRYSINDDDYKELKRDYEDENIEKNFIYDVNFKKIMIN